MALAALVAATGYHYLASHVTAGSTARQPKTVASQAIVGTHIRLGGVSAQIRDKPLMLIFTSKDCHYCQASAQFHKRIIRLGEQVAVPVFVAVPSYQQSREYLGLLNINQRSIVEWKDLGLSLNATPSVVLLGSNGLVEGSWTGQLSGDQENIVETLLRRTGNAKTEKTSGNHLQHPVVLKSSSGIDSAHFARLDDPAVQLIDVRERGDFNLYHHSVAINIPLSELETRAGYELDKNKKYVIDCANLSRDVCTSTFKAFQSFGISAVSALDPDRFAKSCAATPASN